MLPGLPRKDAGKGCFKPQDRISNQAFADRIRLTATEPAPAPDKDARRGSFPRSNQNSTGRATQQDDTHIRNAMPEIGANNYGMLNLSERFGQPASLVASGSIQKHRSLGGGRQSTGVIPTEELVAKPRDNAIAEISDWKRNQPQEGSAKPPPAAQRHQDSTHRCGPSESLAVSHEDHRIKAIANIFADNSCRRRSLQGSEPQSVVGISREQPVDRVVAEAAHTVEKDGGLGLR